MADAPATALPLDLDGIAGSIASAVLSVNREVCEVLTHREVKTVALAIMRASVALAVEPWNRVPSSAAIDAMHITDEIAARNLENAIAAAPRPRCGGNQVGYRMKEASCGTLLVHEHSARGMDYWRCPTCGNSHWWPVAHSESMGYHAEKSL